LTARLKGAEVAGPEFLQAVSDATAKPESRRNAAAIERFERFVLKRGFMTGRIVQARW
jgi:hypothetical protein